MSANAQVLRRSESVSQAISENIPVERDNVSSAKAVAGASSVWNPDEFAKEQIRGLVRRVFLAGGEHPVKQVAFSAAEPNLDVASICERVASTLADETNSQVALVNSRENSPEDILPFLAHSKNGASIQSVQLAGNLWKVRNPRPLDENGRQAGTGLYWPARLAELRAQFEYAVILAPAAGVSSEAALLGQITDGLILVLAANRTRRAAAKKMKETLEASHARILGSVLCERKFPIPAGIYRRL